jgi:hypothetical protein
MDLHLATVNRVQISYVLNILRNNSRIVTTHSSKASTDYPAHIRIKRRSVVERVHTAITRSISDVEIMAEIASREAPGSNRIALSAESSLSTVRSVLFELLAAIVGGKLERKVVVADEATGGVFRFERDTSAVGEARANCPAGLLLQSGAAG